MSPRVLIFALSGLLLLCLTALAVLTYGELFFGEEERREASVSGVEGPLEIGGDFTLTDHRGETFDSADYRGKYLLVFFGYTFCPDICPTTMQNVTLALDSLGGAAERVQPVFITVDPGRDTQEVLAEYVSHFHPSMLALTGSPERIGAAAKLFKAHASRGEAAEDGFYLVNHTTYLYLLGPDGAFLRLFPHSAGAEEIAAQLKEKLDGS